MEDKELKVAIKKNEEEELDFAGDGEPVSPTGQYFNSSAMSISILGFFESDVPIDDSPTMETLEKEFLPINPRFSSIMVRDKNGVARWKKVKVTLEDHVHVPIFPPGLSSYDEHLQDYISNIALQQLPQNRPLWSLHLVKYPTKNAEGTMIFKLHHALGDGYSLMGALFSCIKRFDDPTKPLTFPSPKKTKSLLTPAPPAKYCFSAVPRVLAAGINGMKDFGWSILKSTVLEDDRSPVRSGDPGVEFRPLEVNTVSFPLDDIKLMKSNLGGTVNDVVTGIIFYGLQIYMNAVDREAEKNLQVTALVLLNTRIIDRYQTPAEMLKPGAESKWGNQFGFLHVGLPTMENVDPLEFVAKVRSIIGAKRNSLAVGLTSHLLEMMRKISGPEVTARHIHATLKNTSMTISNMIGPIEQMGIAGHAFRSFYFVVVGSPQSLSISVVSYMGKLKVAFGTEKGFIDSCLLVSCMEKSFKTMFNAAVGSLA